MAYVIPETNDAATAGDVDTDVQLLAPSQVSLTSEIGILLVRLMIPALGKH